MNFRALAGILCRGCTELVGGKLAYHQPCRQANVSRYVIVVRYSAAGVRVTPRSRHGASLACLERRLLDWAERERATAAENSTVAWRTLLEDGPVVGPTYATASAGVAVARAAINVAEGP